MDFGPCGFAAGVSSLPDETFVVVDWLVIQLLMDSSSFELGHPVKCGIYSIILDAK
jgi:hypothetical protein